MKREMSQKEQNLYDEIIKICNNVLEDSEATINFLITAIDGLVDELLKTNEEGLW